MENAVLDTQYDGARINRFQEFMISNIEIRNFRCFKSLEVPRCRQVNVVVGDSGVGKTSLLEAIFIPLAAVTELALRFRQQRGLEAVFNGSVNSIEDAIFGDLFYQRNLANAISIKLFGEGPEARSVSISRGNVQPSLFAFGNNLQQAAAQIPIVWNWTDSYGREHQVIPSVSQSGLQFGTTGEDLPNFFYFSSGLPPSSSENAARFSSLSKKRKEMEFISLLSKEYDWIESLSLEVSGGAAAIHATVKGVDEKIPMPNVSGSFNRITSILLAMASNPGGVVLVDEMDNGVYYQHHVGTWKLILRFARHFNVQIITSTHSLEWIRALTVAAGKQNKDIALWRLEREGSGRTVDVFSGSELKDGLSFGMDVRGGADF